jgi:DNA-binding transcriptional LysR family regulator
MRKNHPLAKVKLDLDNYCKANHLLVSFSGRAHGLVDEALAQISRERRILLTVNQFFTAGRVVANSDLVTVLPRHLIASTGMPMRWCGRNCRSSCRPSTWTCCGTNATAAARPTAGCACIWKT